MRRLYDDKRGVSVGAGIIVAVILIVGVIGAIAFLPQEQRTGGITDSSGKAINCPADLSWSGKVTVQNSENDTGSETYDTRMHFFEVENGEENFDSSITDTTSGSVTLTCGALYHAKIVSASGAAGDSAKVDTVKGSGISGAEVLDNGVIEFTTEGESGSLKVFSPQHGQPEVRAYDLDNLNFFNDSVNTPGTYNTSDGVNFSSNDGTPTAVGSGGELNARIDVRTQNNDESYNDLGMYILVDANTGTWDTPSVSLDGTTLSDMYGELPSDESKAYSAREYAYRVDPNFINPDKIEIELNLNALSGQNPGGADAPIVELAPIGTYQSTDDSDVIQVGAVDDSSSRSDVYTRWTINFDIS